jgi:hypothetical protein
MLHVRLGGFLGVVLGVMMMAARRMRVVSGLLVMAFLVLLRRRAMVLRGMLVVLGGLGVMISSVLGHDVLPTLEWILRCGNQRGVQQWQHSAGEATFA